MLDEAALHRVVGGSAVMREQLLHLVSMSEQAKATIQVVPFGAGAHAGAAGPFVILEFAEAADPNVVYLETIPDGVYLESKRDVDAYMVAFDRLLGVALAPDASVSLIRRVADTGS